MNRTISVRKTSTGYELVCTNHFPKHDGIVFIGEMSQAHGLFLSQGNTEYPGSGLGRSADGKRNINPERLRLRLRRDNIKVNEKKLWNLHVFKNGREQRACTINDDAMHILKDKFGKGIFGDHDADMLDHERWLMYVEIEKLRTDVDVLVQRLVAHISANPPAGKMKGDGEVSIEEWLCFRNPGSRHSPKQNPGSESVPEPG